MNNLSKVIAFKIVCTIVLWSTPLILFPPCLLEAIGFPRHENYMFVRMLGWSFFALCVGYCFALRASLDGKRLMGTIWVGIISNGGACAYLVYYGLAGGWSNWSSTFQYVVCGSIVATAIVTAGLYIYGIKGNEPVIA